MSDLVASKLGDPGLSAYLRAATREWPWAAGVVVPVAARGGRRVLGFERDGVVVAGALLTRRPVNLFRDRERRQLARQYSARGLANLSYVVVRRNHRGQGVGVAFIRAIAAERSFWLACDGSLALFYERCGLERSPMHPAFFVSPVPALQNARLEPM
jgi:GNAT superfamily N-acetyltransferase